jgi:hypothetical protein
MSKAIALAVTAPDPLADLAHKINVCAAKADDYRVAAAQHLAEAKHICGERGITFKEWVRDNVKFSYDESRKLAVAGESEDPAKAIEDMRVRSRQSMGKSRAVQRCTSRRPKPGEVQYITADDDGGADDTPKAEQRLRDLQACFEQGAESASDAAHHIEWIAANATDATPTAAAIDDMIAAAGDVAQLWSDRALRLKRFKKAMASDCFAPKT